MHSNKSDIHNDGKCEKKVPPNKSWKQSTTKNKAKIKYTGRREREEKDTLDLIRTKPGLPFLNVKWGLYG